MYLALVDHLDVDLAKTSTPVGGARTLTLVLDDVVRIRALHLSPRGKASRDATTVTCYPPI
jgi:hypothetical protein